MKLRDVVEQLQARLPFLTDEFTDTLAVTSINHAGTTATVTTPEKHDLDVTNTVYVLGARTPITISTLTHVTDSGIAVATTPVNHDLTLITAGRTVTVGGATEGDFNGTFELLDVPNRRTFHYAVPTSSPTSATGSPELKDGASIYQTLRGPYSVATTPTATTFTFLHTDASDLGAQDGTITVRVKPRITAAIVEDAAFESYTQEPHADIPGTRSAKPWLYATLGDAAASRTTGTREQVTDIQTVTTEWKQTITVPLSCFVGIPTAESTLGRNGRDRVEDLVRPLSQALVGWKPPTGLARGECGQLQFSEHGLARYDRGVYWHAFVFELRIEMTIEDTVEGGDEVAFRDIDMTITPDLDSEQGEAVVGLDANVDLDDTMIP